MTDHMHIKLVPKSDPHSKGHWITVPRRTERYLKQPELRELYAPDIPDDHEAVSFTRFTDIKERLS